MPEVDQDRVIYVRLHTLMNWLAAKHGCTVEINEKTHEILFEGPEENKTALAIDLDNYVTSC
jgi:hypothetical protein